MNCLRSSGAGREMSLFRTIIAKESRITVLPRRPRGRVCNFVQNHNCDCGFTQNSEVQRKEGYLSSGGGRGFSMPSCGQSDSGNSRASEQQSTRFRSKLVKGACRVKSRAVSRCHTYQGHDWIRSVDGLMDELTVRNH